MACFVQDRKGHFFPPTGLIVPGHLYLVVLLVTTHSRAQWMVTEWILSLLCARTMLGSLDILFFILLYLIVVKYTEHENVHLHHFKYTVWWPHVHSHAVLPSPPTAPSLNTFLFNRLNTGRRVCHAHQIVKSRTNSKIMLADGINEESQY